jgi:hypothetical protein
MPNLKPRALRQDVLLDTTAGNPVPNEQAQQIQHPRASLALEAQVKAPSALRLRSHPQYNCHGLTFASRRTAVIDDADVIQILREDGYDQVDKRDVLPGDIAIYYSSTGSIEHSAVVVSSAEAPSYIPFVVSKWGVIGPEVYHHATTGPDYAVSNIIYYRQSPKHAPPTYT